MSLLLADLHAHWSHIEAEHGYSFHSHSGNILCKAISAVVSGQSNAVYGLSRLSRSQIKVPDMEGFVCFAYGEFAPHELAVAMGERLAVVQVELAPDSTASI